MSKTTRIKLPQIRIQTRDDAEAAMNELAMAANNKRKLTARLDAAILKLKDDAAVGISMCDDAIKVRADALRTWAETNPDEFKAGRKSIEFISGILGFRTGTPKLALINRSWNWEKAAEYVASYLPAFIRNKPEVDREAIIGQRDDEAIQAVLPRCGLKVVQDESFFVEPKLTDPEA